MDDVHVARSVLNNKKLINGDLRKRIYERYKGQGCGTCPIVPLVASSAETPDDILLDIAEHNSRYPSGVRYDKKITDQAQETLLKKKAQRNP